jgi:hypothetical protein
MKHWYLPMIFLILSTFTVNAQTYFVEKPKPPYMFAFHAYPFQFGELRFGLELPITDRTSREFGASFIFQNFYTIDFFTLEPRPVTGIGLRYSQRKYSKNVDKGPKGTYREIMIQYRGMIREFSVANAQGTSATYHNSYLNVLSLQYIRGSMIRFGNSPFGVRVEGGFGLRVKHLYVPGGIDNSVRFQVVGRPQQINDRHTMYLMPSVHFNIPISYIKRQSIL